MAGEIMMRRPARLHFAAVALGAVSLAVAFVSLTGSRAHAFSQETLSTNGGNTTRFASPDDRSQNAGQGSHLFGQNGPVVQFGGGQPAYRPFGPRGGYAPPQPLVGGN
jgi:hypothetical protein